jgi:hypothetical protein
VVTPDKVVLFICDGCGKVSQAQTKPTSHRRAIKGRGPDDFNGWEGTPARDVARASGYPADAIVHEEEGRWHQVVVTDHDGTQVPDEEWYPGYVTVRCGPFVRYEAGRAE